MGDRTFLCYLNDDERKVEGYVEILEQTENYLKFKTGSNIITISWNRVLKLKEVANGN